MKYRIVPETVMESAHLKIWRGHVLECCLNLLIIEKKIDFLTVTFSQQGHLFMIVKIIKLIENKKI